MSLKSAATEAQECTSPSSSLKWQKQLTFQLEMYLQDNADIYQEKETYFLFKLICILKHYMHIHLGKISPIWKYTGSEDLLHLFLLLGKLSQVKQKLK